MKRALERDDMDFYFIPSSDFEFEKAYCADIVFQIKSSNKIMVTGGPINGKGLSFAPEDDPQPQNGRFALVVLNWGNEQLNSNDAKQLTRTVNTLAEHLREYELDTLVVTGPDFRHDAEIDRRFVKAYSFLNNLDGLIKLADIVIINPSLDLASECFCSAKRLILLSISHSEEVDSLRQTFIFHRPLMRWANINSDSIINIADDLLKEPNRSLPLSPWSDGATKVLSFINSVQPEREALQKGQNFIKLLKRGKQFLIRIDDVVEIDGELKWLLQLVRCLGFSATLEVIPQLCKISDQDLDRLELEEGAIEVSQHGCSHMMSAVASEWRSEFNVRSESPTSSDIYSIHQGHTIMKERFPRRFGGGFSPPYDGLPIWLPEVWKREGGKYISTIWKDTGSSLLPNVRVTAEVWDWAQNRRRTTAATIEDIVESMVKRGYGGLVLHPRLFRSQSNRTWLSYLLEALRDAGIEPRLPSDLRSLNMTQCPTSVSRAYAFHDSSKE
jgi:hypothetical protein